MWKISIRIWIKVPHLPTVLCALYYCFLFSDWSDEAVTNAEILRLIYQGRFLHCNVTLSALGLATGKTTVMHLVPRENLPEPNSQGMHTMHCILSSLYVFLVNILDSRVPWFSTLNNRKFKSKDKKEKSHASCPLGKLARTKFTRYALCFICFVRVSSKYLGF